MTPLFSVANVASRDRYEAFRILLIPLPATLLYLGAGLELIA